MAFVPVPVYATDVNGSPLSGAKVFAYEAGTTTPQATYTDISGGTAQSNPVVTDSVGRAVLWLNDSLTYKLVLKNAAESQTLFSQDNVDPSTFVGFIIYPAGQGDQNLSTTDSPTFAGMALTGALTGATGTFSGALTASSGSITNDFTVGGNINVTGTVDGVDLDSRHCMMP